MDFIKLLKIGVPVFAGLSALCSVGVNTNKAANVIKEGKEISEGSEKEDSE